MQTTAQTPEVGVIIGRFQVPSLHKAHRDLIEAVLDKHKKVLILLGVSAVRVTRQNPMDFLTRELMIRKTYPKVVVLPISDMPSNADWSKSVDAAIEGAISSASVMLYGSRDAFISSYSGTYPTTQLADSLPISGTAIRNAVSREIRDTPGFRAGVIYAAFQKYPTSYQCVDMVIWRRSAGFLEILLGRKKTDLPNLWRFLGGFVGPEDVSLEHAARREAMEESGGLGLHDPIYLFSARVEDWRYRKESDKIMTAVFAVPYMYGKEEPKDDIDQLQWWSVEDVLRLPKIPLVEDHLTLWPRVKTYLETLNTPKSE